MMLRYLLLFVVLGLFAQEGPSVFELFLPDFFETPFPGGKASINIPDRGLRRLQILVRDAGKRNLNPGRYRVFVNGKGLGNVLEERTVPEGTLLVMEPEALRKRPDELFDPRENALEVLAESRNGRKYYQNWLVRVNDTQQNAFFGNMSVISPEDARGIPPDLIVTEPSVPPVLRGDQTAVTVRLKGRVSRGASVSLNGEPFQAAGQTAVVEFDRTIDVAANQKEIQLEAVDAKGNLRRIVIPVYRQTKRVAKSMFAGQKYAVIIGLSQFGSFHGALPPIPLAATEAEEFASRLEKKAGFKRENIRLLMDEKASPELVRVAFSDFAARAHSNDLLVIYIATHGLHDPRPNRAEQLYLALNGTQIAQLDSTAMSFTDLEMLLNRSVRTNQCVLIFDLGHPLDEEWRFSLGKNLVNNRILNQFGDKPGWSLLVSGSTDELSGDRKSGGSFFGHWLLEGMEAGDLNGDGVITAKELFSFVSEKVKQESGGTQTPRFRVSLQADAIGLVQ